PDARLVTAARKLEIVPDKTQSDVVLGWPGLSRTDPRFVAARVTNMVFAADTFASRVGHVVRDELGLAYYVFSTIGGSRGQSPWIVRMGVNPINVERAVSTTLEELRKIVSAKIAVLDRANEVGIESGSSKGTMHSVPIWVVVEGGDVFIRTYRGPTSRWYRELLAGAGTLVVSGKRIPVRAIAAADSASVQRASDAYRKKYRRGSSLDSMLVPSVLPTTLRLEPA